MWARKHNTVGRKTSIGFIFRTKTDSISSNPFNCEIYVNQPTSYFMNENNLDEMHKCTAVLEPEVANYDYVNGK